MQKQLSSLYRHYLASVVLFHLAAADRVGLSATDYQALNILQLDGPLPSGELAARLGLTTSATTRAIDRLVNAGYARRVPDEADRRIVRVECTGTLPEGLGELLASVRKPVSAALAQLSPEQLAGLELYWQAAASAFAEQTRKIRAAGE